MAITGAASETKRIIDFLTELGVYKHTKPVMLYTDRSSAESLANNDVNHGRTKHIDVKHHWIRDQVKSKVIELQHISTEEQIADIHTKALGKDVFQDSETE